MRDSFEDFCFKIAWEDEECLPPKAAGDVYHYSSLEAIQSILFSNPENLTFWATRSDSFQDKNEGKLVIPRYKEACNKLKEEIGKEAYEFFSNIKPKEKGFFAFPSDDGTE